MENIKALVSEDLEIIEHYLDNFIEPKNDIFFDLYSFVKGKSKRIRSLITLLYLKANNVVITDEVRYLLSAVELVHNASLLHDDVIDNSHFRRGTNTVYDKYDTKISILSGDYILTAAVKNLINLNNFEILNEFMEATRKMSEAEIIQYNNRNKTVSLDDYLYTSGGKTASLFTASLYSAALLTGIDVDIAREFAYKFGILFQINNDMDEKSVQNDRENGVKTAVDILGIEKTSDLKDNYKEELSKILINIPENKYRQGIEGLIKKL